LRGEQYLPFYLNLHHVHPVWKKKKVSRKSGIVARYSKAYSACALHVKGFVDHIVNAFLNSRSLLDIVFVIHDTLMEVAITNVTQDTGKHA